MKQGQTMRLTITFNDKAFAYFERKTNPAHYVQMMNRALGERHPSWEMQGAEVKGRMALLNKKDHSYAVSVTLNAPATALVERWAALRGIDERSYVERMLNCRLDTFSPHWRVGAHITVELTQ